VQASADIVFDSAVMTSASSGVAAQARPSHASTHSYACQISVAV